MNNRSVHLCLSSIYRRCVVYIDTASKRVGGVRSGEALKPYTCYSYEFDQGNGHARLCASVCFSEILLLA